MEGTWGPFYTIGRSSLPAFDTLTRRQDNKTTRQQQQQFESQSTAPFLHYGVERAPCAFSNTYSCLIILTKPFCPSLSGYGPIYTRAFGLHVSNIYFLDAQKLYCSILFLSVCLSVPRTNLYQPNVTAPDLSNTLFNSSIDSGQSNNTILQFKIQYNLRLTLDIGINTSIWKQIMEDLLNLFVVFCINWLITSQGTNMANG